MRDWFGGLVSVSECVCERERREREIGETESKDKQFGDTCL